MRPLMLVTLLATSSLALAACTNAGQASTSTTTAPGAGVAATSTTAGSAAGKAALDPAVAALVPADIKAKGQLSFAMDASYAPFEYFDTDNKTIIGFDADLSQAIGTTMGIKVNDVNAAFDSILIGLTSQKYDVGMSAFSASAERAKVVDFVTYGAGGSGIAVPKGNPKALSMDPMTLCGRTVAAQKGTIQGLDYLPKFSADCTAAGKAAITADLYPAQTDANLAVTSGRADAVMADSVSLALQAKATGTLELAAGPDYNPTNVAVAVPNDSPLAARIGAALKALDKNGTLAAIMAKWGLPTQFATQAKIGEIIK